MAQMVHYWIDGTESKRELPEPETELLPGVRWGQYWEAFTPAYWLAQYWMHGLDRVERSPHHAKGDVVQELVFCMLGGFGISAELATAMFSACNSAGLISRRETSVDIWQEQLRQPVLVNERMQHYRYPNQKSRFLAESMRYISERPLSFQDGRCLRNELLHIKGVGYKTAGWVARNYLDTDDVAILDIHLVRAGILCGIFNPHQKVDREYLVMEDRYLQFCQALGVRAAVMDCLMWDQMRDYGKIALDTISDRLGVTSTRERKIIRERQLPLLL